MQSRSFPKGGIPSQRWSSIRMPLPHFPWVVAVASAKPVGLRRLPFYNISSDPNVVAKMELRTLTAQILLAYEVSFAPGEDGTRLLTKSRDHFVMGTAQLDLVFTPLGEKM